MKKLFKSLIVVGLFVAIALPVFAGSPVGGKTKSFIAAADYGDSKFLFVELTGGRNQCNLCDATTDTPVGVMQNNPESATAMVVQFDGTTKIVASAAIAKGAFVSTQIGGTAVTSTGMTAIRGWALEAATAYGDIIEIMLIGPSVKVQ